VQTSKEALSPTRTKLLVEVPFDELTEPIAAAYKRISGQVRIAGFRPGKVPPRVIDQRVGRTAVLDEALQEALPKLYNAAVEQEKLDVLSQPEVDVTAFADGEPLTFTAEVDVRPEIELPPFADIEVTVDNVDVTDEDITGELDKLRDRFAVLQSVDRPVEDKDYLSIDLVAHVDGKPVEGAEATGISYEVGSGSLITGLDDAVTGAASGDERTFDTELVAGEFAGQTAQVTVTIKSVKAKDLPPLDDDFATTASEFDTLDELKDDTRTRVTRIKKLEQGIQARDRVLDKLVDSVEVPIPESVLEQEVSARQHNLDHQLEQIGMSRQDYLKTEDKTVEDFDSEVIESATRAVKAQFVLDAVAQKEEIQVEQQELMDQIFRRAQQSGMPPEQFIQQIAQAGQLPYVAAEVVRGKALATILEQAKVTDEAGNVVDLEELREPVLSGEAEDEVEQAELADA
jgi:trigger factor